MTPPPLRSIVRATRRNPLVWRYLFNFTPTITYHLERSSLVGETARVLSELNRDGIAITTVKALLGDESCCRELATAVDRLEREQASTMEAMRAEANVESATGKKTFIFELLNRNPVFDPDSIYARFALQQPILQVANAYFGMLTRLRYYNVWHTFATDSQPRESQLWHRDREDLLILKVFMYLSDVDDGAGPFTYATGTHPKGKQTQEAESFMEGNVKRTTDDQMLNLIPKDRWRRGVGESGTIIFADTRGYHKGGLARTSDRLMYTCMFTSQASESEEFMLRLQLFAPPRDRARAFALNASKQTSR